MIKFNRQLAALIYRSLRPIFNYSKSNHNNICKDQPQGLVDRMQGKQIPNHFREKRQLNTVDQEVKKMRKMESRELQEILCKKQLNCTDLAFLAKVLHENNSLEQKLVSRLKKEIKLLKEIEFTNLLGLVKLSDKLAKNNYSNSLKDAFVSHFKKQKFTASQATPFPISFLKQVGFSLFTALFSKNQEETAQVLKTFGALMTVEELKKVDSLCCRSKKTMDVNGLVRYLNIFRQLKRRGDFVDQASQIIIEKQATISPKYLLMGTISLLQLGNIEAVSQLEPSLIVRMNSEGGFKPQEVVALLQLLHKFKAGSLKIWEQLELLAQKNNFINAFQHIFAILSGLTRNYKANSQLLLKFLEIEPTLVYVASLNQKQFIEFYLVVYYHFDKLVPLHAQRYQQTILQSLKKQQLKSVYKEIQYFFIFLFQAQKQRRNSLKKAYPDDLQLALLSLALPIDEGIDSISQKEYEEHLIDRYGGQVWTKNKRIIVVQQFIRHKLMSGKEQHFKDHLL